MMRRTIDATRLYDVHLIHRFSNGHHSMVEVRGVCRLDGQHVRYHQRWRYFALRVALYLEDNPDIDTAAAMMAAASAALNQSRQSWGSHAE